MKRIILLLVLNTGVLSLSGAGIYSGKTDTLVIFGHVVNLEAIDSTMFYRLPAGPGDPGPDERSGYGVWRHDSMLILKIGDRDSVRLVSTPEGQGENFHIYTYLGCPDHLNAYYIQNSYFEGGDYSLFDKTTGKETHVFGYPMLSPDGKTFLCYHADIASGFTDNGLQLFSLGKNGALELLYQTETTWGPDECRWQDDRTICIRAEYWEENAGIKTKFLKLKLPNR